MVGTAVKEGSPGNDKIRFVCLVASDETSCIANKQRALRRQAKAGLSKVLLVVAS